MMIMRSWPGIEEIKSLMTGHPEHFTPEAVDNIGSYVNDRILVLVDDRITGFVVFREEGDTSEILWMAVRSDSTGRGIGSMILNILEKDLVKRGVKRIIVKTLDEKAEYEPYLRTMNFYRRNGFVKERVIDNFWDDGSPCAELVKDMSSKTDVYDILGKDTFTRLVEYHERLLSDIIKSVDDRGYKRIAEFGSGSGFFTLPLIRYFKEVADEIILIDPYVKDYRDHRRILMDLISEYAEETDISLISGRAEEVLRPDDDFDLVIGHEIFCDLTEEGIRQILGASISALKKGGIFIHSGFSDEITSEGTRLLHELDNPGGSSKREGWFSPPDDLLLRVAGRIGFDSVRLLHVKIPFEIKGKEAVRILRFWNVDDNDHIDLIEETGIRFPEETVLICEK
jgi:ribosomal protein S18 acetylase RimI-like enzyme